MHHLMEFLYQFFINSRTSKVRKVQWKSLPSRTEKFYLPLFQSVRIKKKTFKIFSNPLLTLIEGWIPFHFSRVITSFCHCMTIKMIAAKGWFDGNAKCHNTSIKNTVMVKRLADFLSIFRAALLKAALIISHHKGSSETSVKRRFWIVQNVRHFFWYSCWASAWATEEIMYWLVYPMPALMNSLNSCFFRRRYIWLKMGPTCHSKNTLFTSLTCSHTENDGYEPTCN